MLIKLTHLFILDCKDSEKLLKGNKFNSFSRQLAIQAKARGRESVEEITDLDRKDIKKSKKKLREDAANKYKGDGMETFGEAFIKIFPTHPYVQIENYKLVPPENDFGVDGEGIGSNGKVHTVQIKYKYNRTKILGVNENNLTNFVTKSALPVDVGGFGVDLNYRNPSSRSVIAGKSNMTIIHSGKEIHWRANEELLPLCIQLSREHIESLVDQNNMFWNSFRDSWKKSKERLLKNNK